MTAPITYNRLAFTRYSNRKTANHMRSLVKQPSRLSLFWHWLNTPMWGGS